MLAAVGTLLAGCASDHRLIRLKDGAKDIFEQPPCAVKATTRIGQRWVDTTTESGISALGWKRPSQKCADKKTEPKPLIPAPALDRSRWWRLFPL